MARNRAGSLRGLAFGSGKRNISSGPPSPTFSDTTHASAMSFGANGPEKIITRANLKASLQAYEDVRRSLCTRRPFPDADLFTPCHLARQQQRRVSGRAYRYVEGDGRTRGCDGTVQRVSRLAHNPYCVLPTQLICVSGSKARRTRLEHGFRRLQECITS